MLRSTNIEKLGKLPPDEVYNVTGIAAVTIMKNGNKYIRTVKEWMESEDDYPLEKSSVRLSSYLLGK